MSGNNHANGISTILDSITDGFFTLDRNWNFTYFNKAVERIYDINQEDYINTSFWEQFPKTKGLKYWEAFNKATREQTTIHFEEYAPTLLKWLSINVYPIAEGVVVYFRDITDEKESREKILADEHSLRILINNTDDPIWAVDNNCVVLLCNNAFKKWIGYFTGREMGKGDNLLSPDLDRLYLEKFEMCYKLALSGKKFRSVEDMQVDGALRYTTVSFNPVFDSTKQVIGVSCFARDITEQRKHMFTIEAQNVVLKEVAFIQSHKVRGPVASILGLIQLFNRDEPADPVNKDIIDGIIAATDELDTTIKEIVFKVNSIDIGES